MVRMLCSRSASLMSSTLTSRAMAMTILRMVAAWASSREENSIRSSLVTPSMSEATSSPKSAAMASRVVGVSSTVSWSSAACSVAESIPYPARMPVTISGWTMYGSPVARFCPAWSTWASS